MKYRGPCPVVARDRKRGRVLLDGLGVMGVGQMWFEDDGSYLNRDGYNDAPELDSFDGFGTWGKDRKVIEVADGPM